MARLSDVATCLQEILTKEGTSKFKVFDDLGNVDFSFMLNSEMVFVFYRCFELLPLDLC
jgi:hypothetical protein